MAADALSAHPLLIIGTLANSVSFLALSLGPGPGAERHTHKARSMAATHSEYRGYLRNTVDIEVGQQHRFHPSSEPTYRPLLFGTLAVMGLLQVASSVAILLHLTGYLQEVRISEQQRGMIYCIVRSYTAFIVCVASLKLGVVCKYLLLKDCQQLLAVSEVGCLRNFTIP